MNNRKKIVIATGIFPPQIGGPAQYAKELKNSLEKRGFVVVISTYTIERFLPSGIRHLFFFIKLIPNLHGAEFIIALDTFSVGLPAIFAKFILRKKLIIRTGGDFLWEEYVERTGDLIKLSEFYKIKRPFSLKEKIIFKLTKFVLKNSDIIIFSTIWQRDIWALPYCLDLNKCFLVENYFGPKKKNKKPMSKNFIWAVRPIKFKNKELLEKSFNLATSIDSSLILQDKRYSYEKLLSKIESAHALILPSISDISPNFILDGIRYNKPFILTEDTGLKDRLKDIGLFVDPFNVEDMKEKILILADKNKYDEYCKKIEKFTFTHTWDDIASEFLIIASKILFKKYD